MILIVAMNSSTIGNLGPRAKVCSANICSKIFLLLVLLSSVSLNYMIGTDALPVEKLKPLTNESTSESSYNLRANSSVDKLSDFSVSSTNHSKLQTVKSTSGSANNAESIKSITVSYNRSDSAKMQFIKEVISEYNAKQAAKGHAAVHKSFPETVYNLATDDEKPRSKKSDDKSLVKDEASSDDKPDSGKVSAGKSAEDKSDSGKVSAGKSVYEKSDSGKVLAGKSAEDKSDSDKVSAGKSTEDKSDSDKLSAGKSAEDKSDSGKVSAGKSAEDKSDSGKVSAGKSAEDKSDSGKLSAGKSAEDKSDSGKVSAGKSADDKSDSGKVSDRKSNEGSAKAKEDNPADEKRTVNRDSPGFKVSAKFSVETENSIRNVSDKNASLAEEHSTNKTLALKASKKESSAEAPKSPLNANYSGSNNTFYKVSTETKSISEESIDKKANISSKELASESLEGTSKKLETSQKLLSNGNRQKDSSEKSSERDVGTDKDDKPESRDDAREGSSNRDRIRVGAHDEHPDDSRGAVAGVGDHHYDSRDDSSSAEVKSRDSVRKTGKPSTTVKSGKAASNRDIVSEVEERAGDQEKASSLRRSQQPPPPPPPLFPKQPVLPPPPRPQPVLTNRLKPEYAEDRRQSGRFRFNAPSSRRAAQDDDSLLGSGGSSRVVLYFVLFVALVGLLYVVCHRKQKIIACIVESRGRSASLGTGRTASSRNSSGNYRRLPTEEELPAAPKQKPDSVQNFVF